MFSDVKEKMKNSIIMKIPKKFIKLYDNIYLSCTTKGSLEVVITD